MDTHDGHKQIYVPLQFTYNHRPIIPVTLRNGSTTVECQALIDSGSTNTIFHGSLAQALGVEKPDKPKGRIDGISDKPITYYEANIEVGIGDTFYPATVCFSDDLNPNAKNMLGQRGFFDRFAVEFEEKTVLVKEKQTPL